VDTNTQFANSTPVAAPISADGLVIPHDRCWMALALQEDREYNGHEIIIERDCPGLVRRSHERLGVFVVHVDVPRRRKKSGATFTIRIPI
jgi:hypothetical protein